MHEEKMLLYQMFKPCYNFDGDVTIGLTLGKKFLTVYFRFEVNGNLP